MKRLDIEEGEFLALIREATRVGFEAGVTTAFAFMDNDKSTPSVADQVAALDKRFNRSEADAPTT